MGYQFWALPIQALFLDINTLRAAEYMYVFTFSDSILFS